MKCGRVALVGLLVASACTSGTPAPIPEQLTLGDLLSEAEAGQAYFAGPNGQTVIPMSAVVTPPGMDIFYRAPPYGLSTDDYINSGSAPRLNILPGISQGHFIPYVTMEMWTNNFGPVWVQPLYQLLEVDSNGNQINMDPTTQPGTSKNPIVLSTAPPDRFYTPFWRFRNVLVPEADWAQVLASPPQSERDVLDYPYPIFDGPLMLASIIPPNLVLDAPLLPQGGVAAGTVPLPAPQTGFAPWMSAILNADYTTAGLEQFVTVSTVNTVFEGTPFTAVYFGEDWFTETDVNTVPWTPIYAWVTLDNNNNPVPVGLASIAGVDAPFSGTPWNAPGNACDDAGVCIGGQPDWDAFWELYYIVVPGGAAPFFPVVPSTTTTSQPMACGPDLPCASGLVCVASPASTTDGGIPDAGASPDAGSAADGGGSPDAGSVADAGSTGGVCVEDLFAGQRAKFNAVTPSDFVNSLPNVARYAGRMALRPYCFGATSLPAGASGSATTAWAKTCLFLDSQAALEANLTQESFIDSDTSVLCPLMLWAPSETNP